MTARRVVVTGLGLVTPQGTGVVKAWKNICDGVSGIDTIRGFDASELSVRIAGEVKDFVIEDHFDKKAARILDPFVQFGIAAAREAVAESGLQVTDENSPRIGAIVGCGMGGLPTIAQQHEMALAKGYKRISPFFITRAIPNMVSGHISMDIGTRGPNLTLTTACAAGTNAVGEAYRHVKYGMCDAVIAGGTEAVISPLAMSGFASMKALSRRNDSPAEASRPFDRDRDGFVMAEGAGMLVLEEYEHARARGAFIIAEIVGYGLSSDAYHVAAPPENGEGAVEAIKAALADGRIAVDEVDYINAHGTSTPLNDRCETTAIKTVFGEAAGKLAISSTKSMTGHLLGGAGGVESVFTALAVRDQVAPPTINLRNPSSECDLDYVPLTAREMDIRVAISNSFGFGGTNGVIAIQRFEG